MVNVEKGVLVEWYIVFTYHGYIATYKIHRLLSLVSVSMQRPTH